MEIEGTFYTGSNLDIDNTSEVLTSTVVDGQHGVTVTADNTNTGVVYVGRDNTVTAGTAGSTDGVPVYPGQWRFFSVKSPHLLWVIASTANQKAYWDCN